MTGHGRWTLSCAGSRDPSGFRIVLRLRDRAGDVERMGRPSRRCPERAQQTPDRTPAPWRTPRSGTDLSLDRLFAWTQASGSEASKRPRLRDHVELAIFVGPEWLAGGR